jgi:Ca2+-transporting ATPase
LKAANVGVAMGGRGTDVAREAASIVLLDDDFGSIMRTVRLGRRIYDNLRKAMAYIIAVHVPIAGLAVVPLLAGLPLIFGPMHIAFLEMVIDPVCSMVFEAEPEETNIMRARRVRLRPRCSHRRSSPGVCCKTLLPFLHSRRSMRSRCAAGSARPAPGSAAPTVRPPHRSELPPLPLGRPLRAGPIFSSPRSSKLGCLLGSGQSCLVLVNRSFCASLRDLLGQRNRALVWVAAVATLMLAVILVLPLGRELFRFGPLHADDLLLVAAIVAGVVVVLENLKRFWRTRLAG